MKPAAFINQLGHSIQSAPLREIMEAFGLNLHPADHLDDAGNNYWVKSRNKKEDIILTFNGYNRYVREFGIPKFVKDRQEDELILTEIDFFNDYAAKEIPLAFQLPFGFIQGDSKETVLAKLGKKPTEKMTTTYGHAWWFTMEDYRLLTALNKNYELIWLRIIKLNLSEIAKIELKKELSSQRKNINPDNAERVKSFSAKLPTAAWRKRLEEGDQGFTEQNIAAVESILLDYIEMLCQYTKAKKAVPIFNSVKKVVSKLNKANDKYELIETLEREELCDFIAAIVTATGFKIKDEIDLTEAWREW